MGREIDAYAAGVVDSDGCITIKRRKQGEALYFALFVIVGQVGDEVPPVLRLLHETYGGSLQRREGKGRRQPMWHWSVSTRRAEEMLRRILPFLVKNYGEAIDDGRQLVGSRPPGSREDSG